MTITRSRASRFQGDGHSLAKSVDRGESHRYDICVTYPDPALCFLSALGLSWQPKKQGIGTVDIGGVDVPGGPDATLFLFTDEGKQQSAALLNTAGGKHQSTTGETYELEASTGHPVSTREVVGKLERAVGSPETTETPAAVVGYEGQLGGQMSRVIPRRVFLQRRRAARRAQRAEAQ